MDFKKVSKEIFEPVKENKKTFEKNFKDKLSEIFPSTVKDGQVDFKALLEELGEYVDTKERYELTWAGKQNAKKKANEDIVGRTLKYVPEDSKDPETTENLYIEGDNLEVLKLLRNSYYNKIKMIYIDPPYNTGNDFVYNDNFSQSEKETEIEEGDILENERLTVNQKSNGKYHSNWLNMMYPRLKTAKDLLTDDGVIFISIDDNELPNLKKLCDEIFREENCINNKTLIWHIPNGTNKGFIARAHEYIVAYAKNIECLKPFKRDLCDGKDEISEERCTNTPTKDNPTTEIEFKKGLRFDGQNAVFEGTIGGEEPIEIIGKMIFENGKLKYNVTLRSSWRNKAQILTYMKNGVAYDEKGQELFEIYFSKQGKPKYKKKLMYYSPKSVQTFQTENYENNLMSLLKFDNPKPLSMIEFLVSLVTEKNDIVLDFFSGSATSAHAIIKKNSMDNMSRKFIVIQLNENLEKSLSIVKGKAKTSIENMIAFLNSINKPLMLAEIGKERIRRAGKKILEENKDKKGIENLDVGFKVFKTSNTNIRWFSEAINGNLTPLEETTTDKDKLDFNDGFTDIDVVYEILLRHRDIPLSSKIENLKEIGKRTYIFADAVVVCLETEITEEIVDKIAAIEPMPIKIVFRDSAFGDNISLKENTMIRLEAQIKKNSGIMKKSYRIEFI